MRKSHATTTAQSPGPIRDAVPSRWRRNPHSRIQRSSFVRHRLTISPTLVDGLVQHQHIESGVRNSGPPWSDLPISTSRYLRRVGVAKRPVVAQSCLGSHDKKPIRATLGRQTSQMHSTDGVRPTRSLRPIIVPDRRRPASSRMPTSAGEIWSTSNSPSGFLDDFGRACALALDLNRLAPISRAKSSPCELFIVLSNPQRKIAVS